MRQNCEICGASGDENTIVQIHFAKSGKTSPWLCGNCEKDYMRGFFSGRDGERRKMKRRINRLFTESIVDGKFIVNAEEYRQMKRKRGATPQSI